MSARASPEEQAVPHEQAVSSHNDPRKSSDHDAEQPTAKPRPFGHNFWDKELAPMRKEYFIPIVATTFLMVLVVWLFFSIYWGSLYVAQKQVHNLSAFVVNRDPGVIGSTIQDHLVNLTKSPGAQHQLGWQAVSPAQFPTRDALERAIEPDHSAWIAVEIMDHATDKLTTARANGDASWNPQDVVTLLYSSARNYQVVPSMVVQGTHTAVQQVAQQLANQMAAQYLQSSSGNNGALTALSRAPQTIVSPIAMNDNDLRPWNVPLAIAPTFVGLIYIIILTFQIVMASFGARQRIQQFLSLPSITMVRFFTPMIAYIPISLMYSLMQIAFNVPLSRAFPYGGGFMAWWCITYVGMLVCGLVMESVITILGPRFIGIFLIFFIITNVSISNYPSELTASFYKYGYMMPFWQMRHMYLTVAFNSGKHILILKYMGILWAWLLVIVITMPIFIWYDRHQRKKSMAKQNPDQYQAYKEAQDAS